MDPPTAAELVRLGGDPSGFVARDLTVAFCEAADLILTATAEHRAVVLQESPRATTVEPKEPVPPVMRMVLPAYEGPLCGSLRPCRISALSRRVTKCLGSLKWPPDPLRSPIYSLMH